MRWVFALSLILGMLALIVWAMVQGKQRSRPDRGVNAARAIAAAVAFGMGGLSAAYAGWSLWLATLAGGWSRCPGSLVRGDGRNSRR